MPVHNVIEYREEGKVVAYFELNGRLPPEGRDYTLIESYDSDTDYRAATKAEQLVNSLIREFEKNQDKKSNKLKKQLYCSFCGNSQYGVEKLIAGPSVFICSDCVDITVDILVEQQDPEYLKKKALAMGGNSWFERAMDTMVRIEQKGRTVRLIVQTPSGEEEVIEKVLEQ